MWEEPTQAREQEVTETMTLKLKNEESYRIQEEPNEPEEEKQVKTQPNKIKQHKDRTEV